MGQSIVQVDAFTSRPFGGNPAAVCVMDASAAADWMQRIAMEMNLAETAFLWPEADGYRLRWFTPAQEVDLCGHATLASCHTLWTEGHQPAEKPLQFLTRSGVLRACNTNAGIQLDFPADPPALAEPPSALVTAVGAKPVRTLLGRVGYLFELASDADVRALAPDFKAMTRSSDKCVIATAASDSSEFDFVSRFFAPSLGIDEDPVTGAAHCCLSPYWSAKLDRPELRAFQASRRGGELIVRHEGNRVYLTGRAVTVLRGELV